MTAYYNEIDPFAAAWLRNLIATGLIAPGDVDERSIEDVSPDDLRGYTQCHFFAGIGVWSYALRQAGWPDDEPVWTGSCPCQPFSAAGKRTGFADERHLWPAFYHLIRECRPPVVFGEQSASKDGLAWLDLVQDDLEGAGYTSGAVDTCAAGFGAPHIRQRLYWVAYADSGQLEGQPVLRGAECDGKDAGRPEGRGGAAACGDNGGLEHAESDGRVAWRPEPSGRGSTGRCGTGGLAHADGRNPGAEGLQRGGQHGQQPQDGRFVQDGRPGPTNGFWRDVDWLFCRDGKWRPVEPGTFPLAHGAPARVGRLRGYGNAIVAPQAQAFIEAYIATKQEQ